MNSSKTIASILLGVLVLQPVRADYSLWNQPAFGSYEFAASWSGPVPDEDRSAIFGATINTTVSSEIVQFNVGAASRAAWLASGNYTFRFGNPDLTYVAGDVQIGGGANAYIGTDSDGRDFVSTPTTLPNFADLTVDVAQFTSPGTVQSSALYIGDDSENSNEARPGLLTVRGLGTRWINTRAVEYQGNFYEIGRIQIGNPGNRGELRIEGGAVVKAGGTTGIGGGLYFDEDEPLLSDGKIVVSGEGSLFDAGDVLYLGEESYSPGDYWPAGAQGSVEVIEGGHLEVEYRISMGNTVRDSLPLTMADDRLFVGRGSSAHVGIFLELYDAHTVVEVEPNSEEGFGGQITVGDPTLAIPGAVVNSQVINGIGTIIGDLVNYGYVQPTLLYDLTPGTLRVVGDYQGYGDLAIDLSPSGHSKLEVTGSVELGGNLVIHLAPEYVPESNTPLQILEWGSGLSGSFNNIFLPDLPDGQTWDTSQLYISGVISVAGNTSLLGDFDLDGDVDGRDFLMWQRGGSPDPLSSGDLALWRDHYGSGELKAAVIVPEPASVLLLLGVLGAMARGSRRC